MFNGVAEKSARQTVIVVFVLFVFGSSAVEIANEFMHGETLATMGDDVLWFVVSAVLLGVFVFERRSQQRELGALREQINRGRGKLSQLDSRSPELASQYRAVMQKQFDAWGLTASEQDVVILMLKGLSFREIAEIRETQEKTVRQQASGLYQKAGVTGRHELAAWFFEDLLDPLAATSNE